MGSEYKKIDEAGIVIGTVFSLAVYGSTLLMDSTVVGMVVSPVIESAFTLWTWWFFKNHGDPHASKMGRNVAQYVANWVPFIPSILVAFIWKVIVHNHPKTAGLAAGNLNPGAKSKIIGYAGRENKTYRKAA